MSLAQVLWSAAHPKAFQMSSAMGNFKEKQSKSSVLLRCHWIRGNPKQRQGLVCYTIFSTSECLGYYGDGKYVSAWRDWSMKLSAAKTGHCFRKKPPWNKKIHRTGDEINGIGKSQHDLFSLCMCKPLFLLCIYMFCIYSLIVAKTNVFKYILLVLY